MPVHEVYIEPFLGSGAVLRHKKPVRKNIGIDIDAEAIRQAGIWGRAEFDLRHQDAFAFLEGYPFNGDELVYCDPSYLPETRRSERVYRHELTSDDHRDLLALLLTLPCKVMISGYPSHLYAAELRTWHTESLFVTSHTGRREECVWMNFAPPIVPFDLQFLGENFREREQIKRRHSRLLERIARMPPAERALLFSALAASHPSDLPILSNENGNQML